MAETIDALALKSPRAFEEICSQIRARISSGDLKPGDKLPPERDMADQYGVGRNAVREALRSLEIAGLVRLHKGRAGGAFIRPASHSQVTTAIKDLLNFGSITWSELSEARMAVLDTVVRLAAARGSEADFDAIERNLDHTDELTAQGRFAERAYAATDFYAELATAAQNRALLMMVASMTELERQLLDVVQEPRNKPIASLVPQRRALLRHLRQRDGDRAATALRAHLINIQKILQQKLHPGAESPTAAASRKKSARAA